MKKFLLILFLSAVGISNAQETFPVNGTLDKRPYRYAFTNANIVVNSNQTIKNGVVLVNDELIEAVGDSLSVKVPSGYIVINLKGKYIYPSFIDVYTTYGLPANIVPNKGLSNTFLSSKKGLYGWNEAIKSDVHAHDLFQSNKQQAKELRKLGFGAVNSIIKDGIVRGSSVLVALNDNARENYSIIKEKSAATYSFDKGSSKNDYPSSLMGSIALLRQTYYDARWYQSQNKEKNISLAEFNKIQNLPQLFETNGLLDVFRAQKIAKEFGVSYVYKTVGDEYKRIDKIKNAGYKLVVPINFSKPYDIKSISDSKSISLSKLKEWELAPTNLALLEKENVHFAITTEGLENVSDFWQNIKIAQKFGLSQTKTLRALTVDAAEILGVSDLLGTIEAGKIANFLIASDNLFEDDAVIYENWIKGVKYSVNKPEETSIRGFYDLSIVGTDAIGRLGSNGEVPLLLSTDTVGLSLKIGENKKNDVITVYQELETVDTLVEKKGIIQRDGDIIDMQIRLALPNGMVRLSGLVSSYKPLVMKGVVVYPDGSKGKWEAVFRSVNKEKTNSKTIVDVDTKVGKITYPFGAYGTKEELKPAPQIILFRDVTLWTNEKDGVMVGADLLIEGGKIKQYGRDLDTPPGAKVINLRGKHITPGIIDEHSHIAVSGDLNECGKAITSEVSIASVLNPEDINIYRQLAGGVTMAHLLHGSANPIGGQAALIKLKWGAMADDLLYQYAKPSIKFALGENVKQSNWGDGFNQRFPQSRMGVEQVFVDAFMRAREYETARKNYESLAKKKKEGVIEPRRDLSLDPIVEILNRKREITCHSYVQSEMNMLISLADSIGFRINTFTHALEGYKLADKLVARDIAASTFSDWWTYKYEVQQAIPYNAALMTKQGVLVALNSDDPAMGTRLNQEAAKTMKYGGLTDVEALKLITLNPAKILRVDEKVGSLKPGKDADIVIWSANPLSVYTKAEKTYIDGVLYYDIDVDSQLKRDNDIERSRIIQKMIDAKVKVASTQPITEESDKSSHTERLR